MKSLRPKHRAANHCAIEPLESRIAPASLATLAGGSVSVLGDQGAAAEVETLTFTISGSDLHIADPTHAITAGAGFTQSGTNEVFVALASLTADLTVNTGAGADTLTISSALNLPGHANLTSGAITFTQGLALAANKNLTVNATSTINLATANADLTTSGTGTISLTTARDISLVGGASISTVNGTLTLSANQQAAATGGSFVGISLTQADIASTGAGNISLLGTGGTAADSNFGIFVSSGSHITSTSTASNAGTISLTGNGGVANGVNVGVMLTGNGSLISSVSGAISLTGTGQGVGSSNFGVQISDGAQITSTGFGATAATITINGTGGGGVDFNRGVFLDGAALDPKITSIDGNIQITGQGGTTATGQGAIGISLEQGAQILANGSATVNLLGTGGGGTDNRVGVLISGAGSGVTAESGMVVVSGTGGSGAGGTGNNGVLLSAGGKVSSDSSNGVSIDGIIVGGGMSAGISLAGVSTLVQALGSGGVLLRTNNFSIDTNASVTGGVGGVAIVQRDDNLPIDLGGADVPGTNLGISDAELDRITGSLVTIGNSLSGAISVSAAITHANNLALTTGAGISGGGSITLAATKNLSITTTGAINLTGTPVTVPGTLTLSAGGAGASADISMANPTNNLSTVIVTKGANVSLRDDAGFGLGAINVSTLLTLQSNGTITQSAPLTGTGGVTMQGGGQLRLSASNTYAGATTMISGVLKLGAANVIPDGAGKGDVGVNIGAQFDLNGFNETINGLTSNGAVTNSGSAPATLTVGNNDATSAFTGTISGPIALAKTGAGTLTLSSGGNNYSSGTTINAGTLQLGGSGVLPDVGTVTVNGGSLDMNNFNETVGGFSLINGTLLGGAVTLTSTTDFDLQQGSLSVALGGNVGVTVSGGGLVTYNAASSFTGTTQIRDGTLKLSGAALPAGTSVVLGDSSNHNGVLDLNNVTQNVTGLTSVGTGTGNQVIDTTNDVSVPVLIVNLAGGTNIFGGSLGATNANGIALTKTGAGTLVLTGANTYTGATTISAGALQIGNGDTSGTLGAGTVTDNAALVFNRSDALTVANAINGNGSLAQSGSGTLTLNGNDGYTGATTVTAGTLLVGGQLSGTSSVMVSSVARLGGTGTIVSAAPVTINGTLAPGGSPGPFGIGAVTFNGGSSFEAEVNGPAAGSHDLLTVNGDVTLGSATLNVSGTITSAPGQQVMLIDNAGANPIPDTFNNLAEGATVTINNVIFHITYVGGGSGNDVVLLQPPLDTEVTLSNGNLVISDISAVGQNDTLTIRDETATNGIFTITDPNHVLGATNVSGAVSVDEHTLTVPATTVTGTKIQINTGAGDDLLTVDFSAGSLTKTIVFDGGTQAGVGDMLTLAGGTFSSATFDFVDSQITITPPSGSTIMYQGLESILLAVPTADITLNYNSAAANTIDLDLAPALRTRATSPGNPVTTFDNPTNSLTINGGANADTININSLGQTFAAALAIDGKAGTDSVTLAAGLPALAGLTITTENIAALPALTVGAGGLDITTTTGSIDVGGNINATGNVGLHSAAAITNSTGAIGPTTLFADAVNGIALALSGTAVSATNTSTTVGGITLNSVDAANPVTILALNATGRTIGLNGNTFLLTKSETIADTSSLSVGGTFDLKGLDETIGALSGAGMVIDNAPPGMDTPATLQVGGNNGSATFSGTISDNIHLVKAGTGTETLSGANTYFGGTTINAGTLAFDVFSTVLSKKIDLAGGTLFYNLSVPAADTQVVITKSSSIGVAMGKEVTLTNAIGGVGGLTKTGDGTLVLANEFNTFGGPGAPLTIAGGTLKAATDGALGDLTSNVVINNATFVATQGFASGRLFAKQGVGTATIEAQMPFLKLVNRATAAHQGDFALTVPGNTNFGYGTSVGPDPKKVSAGGTTATLGGAGTVSAFIVGNTIDTIELSGTTTSSKLTITGSGTTVNHIIIADPNPDDSVIASIGSITLGPGVTLGDTIRDSVPEIEVEGKAGKLKLYDLNKFGFLDLGGGLPYNAPGSTTPDTYNNHPDLTMHTVKGEGVLIDVTGDGTSGLTGGVGGGGLGKVIVDSWDFSGPVPPATPGIPGTIRTTQSIGSFKLLHGDCSVVFELDRFHHGTIGGAGCGNMNIGGGSWGSSGSEIEGGIGSFSAAAFLEGATLTAGSMGKFTIGAGEFLGILRLTDPDSPLIPTITVNSDFIGSVVSNSPLRKIKVNGDFMGDLKAPFIASISAYRFFDSAIDHSTTIHIIDATDGLGTLTATQGEVRNFTVTTDLAFKGFNIKKSGLTDNTVGIDNVHIEAASIGNISVSLAAAAGAAIDLTGIRDSEFITKANGNTKPDIGSIGNVTVTLTGAALGGSGSDATGIKNSTFDALVAANEFPSDPAASTVNPLGKIAVKIKGQDGASVGLDHATFAANSIGAVAVSVSKGTGVGATAHAVETASFTAKAPNPALSGTIGALTFDGDATEAQVQDMKVSADANVGAVTVKAKTAAFGTLDASAILAGQALDMNGFVTDPGKLTELARATLGAVNVTGSITGTKLVAGGSIGAVTVGKDLTGNSFILAGVKLGGDFLINTNDTWQRTAAIAAITVKGAFASTSIAAGVKPGNSIFGDGDTAATNLAGTSSIGAILILGSLSTGAANASPHQFAIEAGAIKSLKVGTELARTDFSPPHQNGFYIDSASPGGESGNDVLVKLV